jgi:hypothetical protein
MNIFQDEVNTLESWAQALLRVVAEFGKGLHNRGFPLLQILRRM